MWKNLIPWNLSARPTRAGIPFLWRRNTALWQDLRIWEHSRSWWYIPDRPCGRVANARPDLGPACPCRRSRIGQTPRRSVVQWSFRCDPLPEKFKQKTTMVVGKALIDLQTTMFNYCIWRSMLFPPSTISGMLWLHVKKIGSIFWSLAQRQK